MNQYTNKANVEAYLGRTLTTGENSLLTNVIEYISKFIDTYTHRSWNSLTTEEGGDEAEPTVLSRVYDGNGEKELHIKDSFSGLSKIEILDASGGVILTLETAATDWVLYPLNESVSESILLRNYTFPCRPACVKLYATSFGDGAVPNDVVTVCTTLVAKYIQSISANQGFKSESIEGYSYTIMTGEALDTDIKSAISTLDMRKKLLL